MGCSGLAANVGGGCGVRFGVICEGRGLGTAFGAEGGGAAGAAPGDHRGDTVVPDCAEEQTSDACQRPGHSLAEGFGADEDIGDAAERARDAEGEHTEPEGDTAAAAVAIGEGVVQHVVENHDDAGGECLGLDEGEAFVYEQQAEEHEVNDSADGAYEGEEHEADGDVAADEFVEDELEVLEANDEVELALAVLTQAEVVGDFADADLTIGGQDDVEEDLEANGGEAMGDALEEGAADDEEAAHGIGEVGVALYAGETAAEAAEADAPVGEVAHAAAADVAGADDEVEVFGGYLANHLGEHGFVMLEVGIHDGDVWGGGGEHAFDAGGGEAAAADAMEDVQVVLGVGEAFNDGGGAIGGVVVDDDDLVADIMEGIAELLQ